MARVSRQGRLAEYLRRMDFIILDGFGYLPFAQTGGQLLFHLISKHPRRYTGLRTDREGSRNRGLAFPMRAGSAANALDRLIGEQRMPPVVVAFPDCFTQLGGNQYINSASMGAWEDFLLHEMLPEIEQRFG